MKKAADHLQMVKRLRRKEEQIEYTPRSRYCQGKENDMKPDIRFEQLRRFGQRVKFLHQSFYCPKCGDFLLEVVPDDLPERCERCGEPLDFTDVEFVEDKVIGIDRDWRK